MVSFHSRRQALLDFVRARHDGVTREEILEHVYFDDPDNAPESNTVYKMVWDVNRILKKRGLKSHIRCGRGAQARYRFYE